MISDYSEQIHKAAFENCYNKPTQPKNTSHIAVFPDLVSGDTAFSVYVGHQVPIIWILQISKMKMGVGISPPSLDK